MFIRFQERLDMAGDRQRSLRRDGRRLAAGIVYSEWALANPSAWAYHRPMLEENDGWALFITTPRGRNHAQAMFDYADRLAGLVLPSCLTVARHRRAERGAARPRPRRIYGAVRRRLGRAQFEQEYLCCVQCRHPGRLLRARDGRGARRGPHPRARAAAGQPVHRAWDLGIGDDTSIWWFQVGRHQLFMLDHYAACGVGARALPRRDREAPHRSDGWTPWHDYVPHDAKVREWGTGRTRVETMRGAGPQPDACAAGIHRRRHQRCAPDAAAVRVPSTLLRKTASAHWSNTGASGTTRKRRFEPARSMIGRRIRRTPSAIWRMAWRSAPAARDQGAEAGGLAHPAARRAAAQGDQL